MGEQFSIFQPLERASGTLESLRDECWEQGEEVKEEGGRRVGREKERGPTRRTINQTLEQVTMAGKLHLDANLHLATLPAGPKKRPIGLRRRRRRHSAGPMINSLQVGGAPTLVSGAANQPPGPLLLARSLALCCSPIATAALWPAQPYYRGRARGHFLGCGPPGHAHLPCCAKSFALLLLLFLAEVEDI